MKAIILAGGFGTRLKPVLGEETPKSMIYVAGKPLLEYQINFLKENQVTDIILAVHYKADKVKSYFADGKNFGVDITYSEEKFPLGTAGAIKNAEKYIEDTFLVINGDSYLQVDLKEFLGIHKSKRSIATIGLIKPESFEYPGNAVLDGDKIIKFEEGLNLKSENVYGSSGIYIFEPLIFELIEPKKKISLELEIFPRLAQQKSLWGFKHEGYFIDIDKPETFDQFKKDVLKTLFVTPEHTVRQVLNKISTSGIDVALITNQDKKLKGVINEQICQRYLLKGGMMDDSIEKAMDSNPITASTKDSQETVSGILKSGLKYLPILDDNGIIQSIEFSVEDIKTQKYPTLRGMAPLRISFAGGGTDLPSFYEKYKGAVINSTINKYVYATLSKRADAKIIISPDSGEEIIIPSINKINYDGKMDLIKAIIKIMKPEFGFNLYVYNDIPPGRGLGSSASLAVLLVKLIAYLQGVEYDDYKIAELAHKAEHNELNIKGGWQDQYAAVTGGFSFIEFDSDRTVIYPLRLKETVINELDSHLTLCYAGQMHFSGNQQEQLEKSIKEEEVISCMNELKDIAIEIKESLLTNKIGKVGELLHKSWENKRKCSRAISNPKVDELYETGLQNGAYGGKLLGSGGGGYLLFFCPPEDRSRLISALEKKGGEILNFNFEFQGTRIWAVKDAIE